MHPWPRKLNALGWQVQKSGNDLSLILSRHQDGRGGDARPTKHFSPTDAAQAAWPAHCSGEPTLSFGFSSLPQAGICGTALIPGATLSSGSSFRSALRRSTRATSNAGWHFLAGVSDAIGRDGTGQDQGGHQHRSRAAAGARCAQAGALRAPDKATASLQGCSRNRCAACFFASPISISLAQSSTSAGR